MPNTVTLRLAQRSDIPTLATISNAATASSAVHRRMAPLQDHYPTSHYHWRLNIIRERFASPDMRIVVAEDSSSGEILGMSCWAVEGPETGLQRKWAGERTWLEWLEGRLIWAERRWGEFAGMDRSVDSEFLRNFMDAFQGDGKLVHPAYLCIHLITVAPSAQGRGVGRMLVDWGKELAAEEELPIFLEASVEAVGFYEKGGFSRMSRDFVVISPGSSEPFRMPIFVWEGERNEGRWLERDRDFQGLGERWKWRDDVLPK